MSINAIFKYRFLLIPLIISLIIIAPNFIKNEPTKFIITTHGGTGSTWLAAVLNRHKNIVCTHFIHDRARPRNVIKQSFYSNEPLDKYFSILKKHVDKDTRVLGNLNGYVYANVRSQLDQHPDVTVINMVRHPVSRIMSLAATWSDTEFTRLQDITEFDLYEEAKSYYNEVVKRYNVSFENDVPSYMFLHVIAQQDQFYIDTELSINDGIPQLYHEDIVTHPLTLKKLVQTISKGKINLSTREAQVLLGVAPRNKHHKIGLTDKEKYETWQPWQKYAFYLHLRKNNALNDSLYTRLGYDLDFIEKNF